MLHPRDPGGERLTRKRGEENCEGARRVRPAAWLRPAGRSLLPLRSARRQRSGGAAPDLLLAAAPLRPDSGSCTAPCRRPDTAPQRSADQAARSGRGMQSAFGQRPIEPRRGGDMQSAAPGGQWGGALRLVEPPLGSAGRVAAARRTAPHRTAQRGVGGGFGPAPMGAGALLSPASASPGLGPGSGPASYPWGRSTLSSARAGPPGCAACGQAGPRRPVPKARTLRAAVRHWLSGTAGSRVWGEARGGMWPTMSQRTAVLCSSRLGTARCEACLRYIHHHRSSAT